MICLGIWFLSWIKISLKYTLNENYMRISKIYSRACVNNKKKSIGKNVRVNKRNQ